MTATKLNRRYLWIAGLVVALGALLLFSAPAGNRLNTGSTWANGPAGYGAWYAYMEENGAPIERWQRPADDLLEEISDSPADKPATLLRVMPFALPGAATLGQSGLEEWLEKGNHLIVLVQQKPATAAPFSTQLTSAAGDVTIETSRRLKPDDPSSEGTKSLLADDYDTVVWQAAPSEPGRVIFSTTPYLAANAYLDSPGNFAFLSEIVQAAGGPIWVDEYLHGYKDRDVVVEETAGSWLGYLAKTPLLVIALQGGVILFVVLITQNRRIGNRRTLPSVAVNNSEAYIKALAGVLHKANNHDFLVETLTRTEQKALQRALGLGDVPVSLSALQSAWQQSTGRSPDELNVLQGAPRGKAALRAWLRKIQSLPSMVHK